MKQTRMDSEFERQIHDYLQAHPDYFQRHQDLLDVLFIPHPVQGATSLLEFKLRRLEKRYEKTHHQLQHMLEIARANEKLHQRLHKLTLKLIEARSREEVRQTLEDELRERFHADAVSLKLFTHEQLDEAKVSQSGMAVFRSFMNGDQPTCGPLQADKLHILFGKQAGNEGSAALIPIRTPEVSGILAIGSHDKARFHPGKGIDFLTRLGEVVSLAIQATRP